MRVHVFRLRVAVLALAGFALSPPYSSALNPHRQPEMLSEASTFRPELGGTLTLPCRVKDLGPFTVTWKKGNR